MDIRIWKYELKISDHQMIEMPIESEILSVKVQDNELCLWAKVDTKRSTETRVIEVFGTGNPVYMDMGVSRRFIETVVMDPFVWHVFERYA